METISVRELCEFAGERFDVPAETVRSMIKRGSITIRKEEGTGRWAPCGRDLAKITLALTWYATEGQTGQAVRLLGRRLDEAFQRFDVLREELVDWLESDFEPVLWIFFRPSGELEYSASLFNRVPNVEHDEEFGLLPVSTWVEDLDRKIGVAAESGTGVEDLLQEERPTFKS